MTVSRQGRVPFPKNGGGRKRASAGTDSRPDDSGSATRRALSTAARPEDPALLSKPGPGAPSAVEILFERHHEQVYGLAMSILMNRGDAEEATKEVFLAVVRKADRFQENPALPSWIFRVCVNTCLTRLRKGRRTESLPIQEFLPVFTEEGAHAGSVEDWSGEVERRIPEKELGQVIGRFTAALPEKYLVVFALRDVQRFSSDETARILNMTIAEVKTRSSKARFYVRERLSRYLRNGRAV